jgi:hypothetical protein
MHRLWIGSDPALILGGLGFFLAALALIIHMWAYSITGWPRYKRAQYNPGVTSGQLQTIPSGVPGAAGNTR